MLQLKVLVTVRLSPYLIEDFQLCMMWEPKFKVST